MAATLGDIKNWLGQAKTKGATHLIVACDDFGDPLGDCCYPKYVMPDEDPEEQAGLTAQGNRVMEVYSLTGKYPIEDQLAEFRAHHYD